MSADPTADLLRRAADEQTRLHNVIADACYQLGRLQHASTCGDTEYLLGVLPDIVEQLGEVLNPS